MIPGMFDHKQEDYIKLKRENSEVCRSGNDLTGFVAGLGIPTIPIGTKMSGVYLSSETPEKQAERIE